MNILDLIFPKWCVGCGRIGKYVCDSCTVGLYEVEQICPACCLRSMVGKRHRNCSNEGYLDGLTCLWAYEGIAEKVIRRAKYKGEYDLLKELIRFENMDRFRNENYVVVPVPLYKKRERERGFNQAEHIAKSLASRHSLSLNSHLLVRTRDTGHQVGRDRKSRLINIQNAFSINDKWQMKNDKYLLVDDVWTTGATMQECAKVLKKAGAKSVWGLVLAR